MYERMLQKQEKPSLAEMEAFCGENAERFSLLNEWLSQTYGTVGQVAFPYGNHYGWGIAHRKNKKLICYIFAENHAFTVMMRLTNVQFESVYHQVGSGTQEYIDNRYPCNDGGWIHYRVIDQENFEDIRKLLSLKFS